jgi:hypothetical protein
MRIDIAIGKISDEFRTLTVGAASYCIRTRVLQANVREQNSAYLTINNANYHVRRRVIGKFSDSKGGHASAFSF